jgi:hypothetical protein
MPLNGDARIVYQIAEFALMESPVMYAESGDTGIKWMELAN